jgi:hypothetical protein
VLDRVTIAYRGAKYEIGRGRSGYAIWAAGAPRSQPLGTWPDTDEGWAAAWARFTEIEAPGTITPAGRRLGPAGRRPGAAGPGAALAGPGSAAAALLLAGGVALGVAGLFPAYLDGAALAGQPYQLVAHAIYLAAWAGAAVLILAGGAGRRAGALLAAGTSAVTFGLFFADLGTVIAGGAHLGGAGLVLGLLGWLACAAGSVTALLAADARDSGRQAGLGRPRGTGAGAAVLLVLAGLGAAAAFAPSWDSFTLRTAAGQAQYLTAGNAFHNPAPVIAGDVVVMVALAAVVIAAAAWRPARHGAALLAGATIPMAAQGISAIVQAGQGASPQQFGISPAEAGRLGLTISSGLTPAFWVYGAFVVVLAVSCAWMLLTPHDAPGPAAGGTAGLAPPGTLDPAPGTPDPAPGTPDPAGEAFRRPQESPAAWYVAPETLRMGNDHAE